MHKILGNLGDREYKKMGRPLAPCGTRAAYNRHLRNKEQTCEPCRLANSEAHKKWRTTNPEQHKVIYKRNNKRQWEKIKAKRQSND